MGVDYTPTMKPYEKVGAFRYWCQTTLPLVYDDSKSYLELLYSVIHYLNSTISDVANMGDNIDALLEAYNQLQKYVNDYFDNLDVQEEINAKLDEMATDGTLDNLLEPFVQTFVGNWLEEHLTPTTPPIDNTLTIEGAGADAKVVGNTFKEVSSVFNTQNIYSNKLQVNSRWPRISVPAQSGTPYFVRVIEIQSAEAYDSCWLSQGETVLTPELSTGNTAVFMASGNDPVYLNVRYATEPQETPYVIFELKEAAASNYGVKTANIAIDDTNKALICNGDIDNLPGNTIYGVRARVTLDHAPADFNSYYLAITLEDVIQGITTSGKVQIAIQVNNARAEKRVYNGVNWSAWENYDDKVQALFDTVSNELNIALNEFNLHLVKLTPNSRWPRAALDVTGVNNYIIKVHGIISDDPVDACFVNQGDAKLATELENTASKVFTTDGTNICYLTVRYEAEPSSTPYVLYSLRPSLQAYDRIMPTDLIVDNDNKAKLCNSSVDDLPLGGIYGIGNNADVQNMPFLKVFHNMIGFGKYFSRTAGDVQVAIKPADKAIAYRIATAYNVWGKWRFNTRVSRFAGLKFSVIGDSISTFDQSGYKIEGFKMAYPYLDVKTVDQTWWMRVIQASDADLEVNASWSGSCVTTARSDEVYEGTNYPDFYTRCNLLGSPDIIFVALGTNDSLIGSILRPELSPVEQGNYDYDTPYTALSETTFRTAYIKGIKALQANYPHAKIVCLILSMGDAFAESIRSIASTLNCYSVECRNYRIQDNTVHPGVIGMRQISSKTLYPDTAVF